MILVIVLVLRATLVLLAHMCSCLHELDEGKSSHVFTTLVIQIGFDHHSHSCLIFLAIETQHLLDFTQSQMEPFRH